MTNNYLPESEQVAALLELDPGGELQRGCRLGDVPFLRLLDGRELVHPIRGGGYDVWARDAERPLLFGLSLSEARRLAGVSA